MVISCCCSIYNLFTLCTISISIYQLKSRSHLHVHACAHPRTHTQEWTHMCSKTDMCILACSSTPTVMPTDLLSYVHTHTHRHTHTHTHRQWGPPSQINALSDKSLLLSLLLSSSPCLSLCPTVGVCFSNQTHFPPCCQLPLALLKTMSDLKEVNKLNEVYRCLVTSGTYWEIVTPCFLSDLFFF